MRNFNKPSTPGNVIDDPFSNPYNTGNYNDDPFGDPYTQSGHDSDPFGGGLGYGSKNTDPFARTDYGANIPVSQEVTDWAAYMDNTDDPFARPQTWEQTVPVNHEQGEGVRAKFAKLGNKIVELSGMVTGGLAKASELTGKAGRMIGRLAPGSKLDRGLKSATGYMEAGSSLAGGIGGVTESAQSAWDNRGQIMQGAAGYGLEAGLRVAGSGANAALNVLDKRTGISIEKGEDGKNKLKVRKAKLARFALKTVMTGGAIIPKVGVEAGLAARKAVTKGAQGELKAARQSAKDMAMDAFSGNNPFSRYDTAPSATSWESGGSNDW